MNYPKRVYYIKIITVGPKFEYPKLRISVIMLKYCHKALKLLTLDSFLRYVFDLQTFGAQMR